MQVFYTITTNLTVIYIHCSPQRLIFCWVQSSRIIYTTLILMAMQYDYVTLYNGESITSSTVLLWHCQELQTRENLVFSPTFENTFKKNSYFCVKNERFYLTFDIYCMHGCLYLCTICMAGTHRGQKKVLDFLELGL